MDIDPRPSETPPDPGASETPPDEIYNTPSAERISLLIDLQDALGVSRVPAPFWACLHVCHISRLRALVNTARVTPIWISLLSDCCASIPLRWVKRRIPKEAASPPTPSRHGCPSSPDNLAKERDNNSCVLTKADRFVVTRVYPDLPILSSLPAPAFAKLLVFFWESRLSRWSTKLFRGPAGLTTVAPDGCSNFLCMHGDLARYFNRGQLALRPVSLSEDKKELVVELYWQPRAPHTFRDEVDILQVPCSSRDLDGYQNNRFTINVDGREVGINSGDSFTLTTADPTTHPLPSFHLLDMQWHLNRVVAMSGATDANDDVNQDDDDDGDDGEEDDEDDDYEDISEHAAVEEWQKSINGIVQWVQSLMASSNQDNDGSPDSVSVSPNAPSLKTDNSQPQVDEDVT
ncbi:hypothetical protein FQN52_000790 [Onygenales sp. PD_12]|nr:hypothetical protein FQN53_007518 [Emmonsiellopsis sp. PD_33]KAK2782689.1 hypothetical protein FQN52_000790 [Onygenales sp. PD_12]